MATIRNSSRNNVFGEGKEKIFTTDDGKEYVIRNSSLDNVYGKGKQKIVEERGSSNGGLAEMIADILPWWGCLLLVIIIIVVCFVFPGEFWGFVGKVLFFIPNLFI